MPNFIYDGVIYLCSRICISMKISREFSYRVKEGDSISSIIAMFNTEKSNIIRNNPDLELYPGEWVKIKVNDYTIHIVKPMESLSQISQVYEISPDQIKRDNSLESDHLYIGQTIKIYKQK